MSAQAPSCRWRRHSRNRLNSSRLNSSRHYSSRLRPRARLHQLAALGLLLLLLPAAQAQGASAPAETPSATAAEATGATLEVCPSGCQYRSVTQAVDAAVEGDTVLVQSGVYLEPTIRIEKPLTLEGRDWPVLDAQGEGSVVHVLADHVTVRGFVLQNSGFSHIEDVAALRVGEFGGCNIENNRVLDSFFGIYLEKSVACTVTGNEVRSAGELEAYTGNAIHAWSAYHAVIQDNYVTGHRDGIYLEFARNAVVEGNVSEGNLRYGLHYMFTNDTRFERNVFRDNGAGTAVMYSRNIDMVNNRFEDNWGAAAYGLLLKDLSDSDLSGNTFDGNTAAVYIDGANRTNIERNDFMNNGYAMRILSNSMGVLVTHNNFIGNTFDVVTNSDRSYNSFIENYWDAYEGYDLNRDGLGDVPYRPVRLFAMTVQAYPQAMVLLRSPLSQAMEYAERLLPVITPKAIEDDRPLMGRIRWSSLSD